MMWILHQKSNLIKKINQIISHKRFLLKIPKLNNVERFKKSQKGIQGLFGVKTLNQIWDIRGNYLINKINEEINQHKEIIDSLKNFDEKKQLSQLLKLFKNDENMLKIRMYVSQIMNTHFFFEGLKENEELKEIRRCTENDLLNVPFDFESRNYPTDNDFNLLIVKSFGSLIELKSLLINSAKTIKGDGMSWLVAVCDKTVDISRNFENNSTDKFYITHLSVMNTYNAGFVNIDNGIKPHDYHLSNIINRNNLEITNYKTETKITGIEEYSSSFDDEQNSQNNYANKKLIPLLCIDASHHNYLLDYSVFGKHHYLNNVWECIDWDVVLRRLPKTDQNTIW